MLLAVVLGPPSGQDVHQLLQLQPELGLGTAAFPVRLLGLKAIGAAHGREEHLGTLDADDNCGALIRGDLVTRHAGVALDVLDALDAHAEGAHTVHGRRLAALLEVARHGSTGLETALGLLLDHVCDHLRGVGRRSTFVAEYELAGAVGSLVVGEVVAEELDVALEHVDIDPFLGDIDRRGAHGQTGGRGDVARLAALGLDDEHAASRRRRGLADSVAEGDQGVETGVAAERVLGAGHVVGDGGGQDDERDAERRVLVSGATQLADGREGLEAANDEEGVEAVALEAIGSGLHVLGRQAAVGANLRAALVDPVVRLEPLNLADRADRLVIVVAAQAGEAVVDGNGGVAAGQAVGHGGARRGVHATGRGADVDNRNAHALVVVSNIPSGYISCAGC